MKWIGLFTLLISANFGHSQDLKDTYAMGITHRQSGNFQAAIRAFERVIFFDEDNRYTREAYYQIAQCHLELDLLNQMFQAYDKSILYTPNDTIQNVLSLEKVYHLLQAHYWKRAKQELFSIEPIGRKQTYLHNYYLGIVHFATNDLVQSEYCFQQLIDSQKDSLQLAAVFIKARRKLNPNRALWAKRISYFIPGSGQLMALNIKSGLNSMLLISGLGLLYYNTVEEYGLLSGMITVLPWLSRYHVGGAENAEESMISRQEKVKSRYFDEIVEIVAQ